MIVKNKLGYEFDACTLHGKYAIGCGYELINESKEYELVFANRSDRTIKVSRRIALSLSHIFKSPRYIMVMTRGSYSGDWHGIENGVIK